MLFDDRDYLSLLTGAALAVLMLLVMFWIRSQIPDEQVAAHLLPLQVASADTYSAEPVSAPDANTFPQSRRVIAAVYECVQSGHLTLSDRPCGPGAVLLDTGMANVLHAAEGRRVHQR